MEKRFIVFIVLAVVLIIGGAVAIFIVVQQEKAAGIPKIKVALEEYDAGTVSMADGLVSYVYKIKNNGSGNLEINNLKTSCTCTTAVIEIANEKSPEFGMHNEGTRWVGKVPAGKEAELEVNFDPNFHGPEGTGNVVRIISFDTNDPQKKEVEVKLTANVIK